MRRLILLASLAAALAGCGGGASRDADEILSETAANLGKIQSGDLRFALTARAEGGETVGFELDGSFALAKRGALPVTDMEYTQIAGSERGTIRFLSTGDSAFVVTPEGTFELPDEQVADLRAGGSGAGEEGLETLRVEDWMIDPAASEGEEIGGDETDHVRAKLNVVTAINDLVAFVRGVAGSAGELETLDEANAEQVRRAVESATIDVYSGKDDRLLRRLVIKANFGVDLSDDLKEALGSFAGASVTLDLTIANPNQPVKVKAPADAQPFPG